VQLAHLIETVEQAAQRLVCRFRRDVKAFLELWQLAIAISRKFTIGEVCGLRKSWCFGKAEVEAGICRWWASASVGKKGLALHGCKVANAR
jgi:hypothetical protein